MPIHFIYIVLICQLVLVIITVVFVIQHFREKKRIRALAGQITKQNRITTIQDVIKIKNYLQKTIQYDINEKQKNRPLLRATALQTLKNGIGFCGENARAAILLLRYAGIKANRIYLYGQKWQHVVVEMKWKGQWCLFDGHNDPNMLLSDDMVCKIPSEDIASYPNNYPMNPWLDFCRIKFLRRKPFPKKWSKIRLAGVFVAMLESPNLTKAIFFLFLLFISFLSYLII